MKRLVVAFSFLIGTNALSQPPARAEVFYVCTVKETADGYVALRSRPSTKARLLARMKPEELLVLDRDKRGELVNSGGWLRGLHYPGETFPDVDEPEYKKVHHGWVRERLVGDCG